MIDWKQTLEYYSKGGTQDITPAIRSRYSSTFSGCDMQVSFFIPGHNPQYKVFGELQTLSISSARSFSPVRTLGRTRPKEYLRGGRTYAGSLILTELDYDALLEVMAPSDREQVEGGGYYFFVDQLPEFNITITATNEYGRSITRSVIGVTLINYGTTLSVDNMYTESQYTYVAQHVTPFAPGNTWKQIHKQISEWSNWNRIRNNIKTATQLLPYLPDRTVLLPEEEE